MSICLKGTLLSKALTCLKLIRNIVMFPFGYIVVTPQHTDFEHSAACLSVVLVSLNGFIPFAIA